MEVQNTSSKKNNLNTKMIPPILMLIAGVISFVICLVFSYDIQSMLIVLFISMLVFAIIGTIVKSIVDKFNMKIDYDDLLEMEDAGSDER